jgi:eukaryotic-like serine/threonine-protein kinase
MRGWHPLIRRAKLVREATTEVNEGMPEAQQQRYRVIERLAAGGMAEVYRAESAGLEGFKKKVAIKRVLPHLSEKKKFIQMFLDEARLGAHLSHSNCVQVFDVGVGDNAYFIVMEYVDGADLKAVIEWLRKQGKPFPAAHAVYIAIRICEGLDYAHELVDETGKKLHIVHRDLSPPNVLITKFGEIKIVDFGLAKASTQLEKSEAGIIKGKFSYLSPEAALGQEVDLRTDIFAAAIILWELLGGRKLFQGETDFETVKQVQRAEIPSISRLNPNVDSKLEAIINKGLARDPNTRYRSARDFAMALNEWLFQSPQVVSSFEIAEIVQNVVKDRNKEGKASNVNIIDTLIQQTLFEFTSVQNDSDGGKSPVQANKKLDASGGSQVDVLNWGSELNDIADDFGPSAPADRTSASSYTPPLNLSEGNLASLEEDPESAKQPGLRSSTVPPEPPSSTASPEAARQSRTSLANVAPMPTVTPVTAAPGKPVGLIAAVLFAVVAVGVAGAYMSGLFNLPHSDPAALLPPRPPRAAALAPAAWKTGPAPARGAGPVEGTCTSDQNTRPPLPRWRGGRPAPVRGRGCFHTPPASLTRRPRAPSRRPRSLR